MKHLFASKTFWFNVLGIVSTVAGVLPPHAAGIVLPIANIGLRMISNKGVTLLPQGDDSTQ